MTAIAAMISAGCISFQAVEFADASEPFGEVGSSFSMLWAVPMVGILEV
jgi:hypothetical protein